VLLLTLSGDPEALASDGFHPGRQTYRLWAAELAVRILRAGRSTGYLSESQDSDASGEAA